MKLSVIILNYNVRFFLEQCILSVQVGLKKIESEIIVVDNNSSDDSCQMVKQLFPEIIQNAAQNHSPALIANYTYELVKEYNSFYQTVPILGCTNEEEKIFRTQLSSKVSEVIKDAFNLLGINVPNRM